MPDPNGSGRLGQARAAVYAFYDFDGEPIYNGQTSEGVSSRIGRHLTGQRSDAVAKFVLDPFEVAEVEVWTIPDIANVRATTAEKRRLLDVYEFNVYQMLVARSRFGAMLNEKIPSATDEITLPQSLRGRIIPDDMWEDRSHPDVRIARRASQVGRLAQLISEREPSPGLRRTLHLQTQRLEWLSNRRIMDLHYAIPVYGDSDANRDEADDE